MTPDDHYCPNTTCHHCHNLQHYLLNITKYFTSNTQLLFLPGLHHLHTDLLVQNVHNISLIGSTANGTTLDTVIIQCDSSVGITMSNITDLTMANLAIVNCKINRIFSKNGITLSHCYNIELQNIKTYTSDLLYGSTIIVTNTLGISSLMNLTCDALQIYYNEVNFVEKYNVKLLIRNYQIPSPSKHIFLDSVILIHLNQKLYTVEIEVNNAKFSGFKSTKKLVKVIQTTRNFIYFNHCTVEKINTGIGDLFYFESSEIHRQVNHQFNHQVTFTNCAFRYIKVSRLFTVHGELHMRLENCIFKYSQFQVIRMIGLFYHHRSMVITNTSFYAIKSNNTLIYLSTVSLYLDGPVVFTKVKAKGILYNQQSTISYHNYIEFSENVISFTEHTDYIIVQENTLINMTNNDYSTIQNLKLYHYETYSTFEFTAPCYYQYTAEGQNFDRFTTRNLNFSIVFHNDISIHTLITTHCRWLPGSAFNSIKPIDINNKIIKSYFPLMYQKHICYCFNGKAQNCFTDKLAVIYPGQTISLSLILNLLYNTFKYRPLEISKAYFLTVEINDDVLPSTACKLAKVSELIHEIYYSSCTVINFTIVHNGLSYLQWCELFIDIIVTHQTDVYYIEMLPCPAGFVYQNGICICDPILNSVLPVTTCDINKQTILRPAGSWLSAVTINNSHQYHISLRCPLYYCLPQSSQLNFSTPNSQCQFNRSGLLCGHCQQDFSTVLGSFHCQHCSNVYLLIVIAIAVVGLMLVLLLFVLNLTVTDGDINGFTLYVSIISINNHVFFPQNSNSINIFYAFISLANLDLGIPMCFYNGMDDYAKMWLQLAFPAYLILIATLLIIASRHSTKIQRITARRALPVLATLFLLSYTKILRTVSDVLFYYSTITHLPSGHTTLVWAVDANIPLFGLIYTTLFVVCLILFVILLSFNAILCFTKTAMRLQFVNHFKPLIDAYQGPYKYKYYYWTGLQLVVRAIFFGLSALDRNINFTVAIILLAVIIIIQRSLVPFKDNYKNLHETAFLLNLLTIYTLSYGQYNIAINVMITIVALQFLLIIIHHMISNIYGGVILYKLKNFIEMTVKWINRSQNKPQHHIELNNTPLDKAYNYQELREPLVSQD